ncbi:MAG: OmpA family protein [Prevotella sp.]
MKKLGLMLAAATFAASASAQTVTGSKTFDNMYVGVNGGVMTDTKGHKWLSDLNANAGLRIGRNFTPVFGLAVESNAYFAEKPNRAENTFVKFINTSLLGTTNLSNWFGGYKGTPRCFELVAVYGLGWAHTFNNQKEKPKNYATSKLGLDFAFNFGSDKQWQFYVEPSITYALNGESGREDVRFGSHRSFVQLNGGLIYKFKGSNGSHNFTLAQLRDQAEIDGLNAQINGLRNDLNVKDAELNGKDARIADLQKALQDANNRPATVVKEVKETTVTNLQPTVLFRQGQSVIDQAQYAPIELIASYMRKYPTANIEIRGYASPEGNAEFNQKLSTARAEAVKKALVKKYKIAASRLTTKGMGVTDTLFEEVSFNRVATFNDNAK